MRLDSPPPSRPHPRWLLAGVWWLVLVWSLNPDTTMRVGLRDVLLRWGYGSITISVGCRYKYCTPDCLKFKFNDYPAAAHHVRQVWAHCRLQRFGGCMHLRTCLGRCKSFLPSREGSVSSLVGCRQGLLANIDQHKGPALK